MRLLLVRHGETVDNVAGVYAGITDSPLTNHGVLQANRLGAHLSWSNVEIHRIFSSDLQRAIKTAEAIRSAQPHGPASVKQLPILREQDFGFYEGKRFIERARDINISGKDAHLEAHRNDPGFRDVESKESMRKRADTFVEEHLIDCFGLSNDQTVVVVAHGIILNHLWRAILGRFKPATVTVASGVDGTDRGLEYLGGWSNTGYLDLEIKKLSAENAGAAQSIGEDIPSVSKESHGPVTEVLDTTTETLYESTTSTPSPSTAPAVKEMTLAVKAVNSLDHLKGLKKTRGGIGSLKHDSNQKTMDSFFKKRELE